MSFIMYYVQMYCHHVYMYVCIQNVVKKLLASQKWFTYWARDSNLCTPKC